MASSLSQTLLESHAVSFERATQHDFLRKAGQRTLKKQDLEKWLLQDAVYASEGYPRALGFLATKLTHLCPVNLLGSDERYDGILAHRLEITKLIGDALTNIARELAFFRSVADDHGLDLGAIEEAGEARGRLAKSIVPNTRNYVAFQIATCAAGTLEEGLILLWAMEEVYLRAWQFAKSHSPASSPNKETSSALDQLIENWTSSPFERFVDDLRKVVDLLDIPLDPTDERYQKAEAVLTHVLWLEERFWPEM